MEGIVLDLAYAAGHMSSTYRHQITKMVLAERRFELVTNSLAGDTADFLIIRGAHKGYRGP